MTIVKTKEPLELFNLWFNEAKENKSILDPNAACLATADDKGRPSARIILVKGWSEKGFCFYTNFNSRKGGQLLQNRFAALCLYWECLHRQIRIEGAIQIVSEEESDEYFMSRRRESRIGAYASLQSEVMENGNDLNIKIKYFNKAFEGKEVARPKNWGGFRLIPDRIEFWEEGEFRLHKRLVFIKNNQLDDDWDSKILYP